MSLNSTAYCLLPTPYSQGDVARLLRFGITLYLYSIAYSYTSAKLTGDQI
ncbi:MAG: hypothetical protein F6K23_33985 [Okeania sp. SIO2C9]|nr:hypothetical protein [Okeania sp. SIO2C9]NEQ77589.1 hypothetical protein [Okeania sp. SIO2C9]